MKLPLAVPLSFIASQIGGKLTGDPNVLIDSVAENPKRAKSSDLVILFNESDLPLVKSIEAKALIVPDCDFESSIPHVKVYRPLLAFRQMLKFLDTKRSYPKIGIHQSAIVGNNCIIDESACIGPNVVIGDNTKVGANTKIMANCVIGANVTIKDNTLIYPLVCVADDVMIGNNVIIQQGVSIGSDGFGYVTAKPSVVERRLSGDFSINDDSNPHLKIPQIGSVIIEDDVEVGSNSSIARGTVGNTIIGQGTKIDDLVLIAHNVIIGKECIIAGNSGIAGSCVIGDRTVLAGGCGLKDHLHIGKEVILEAFSGVMRNIDDADIQLGIPAINSKEKFRQFASVNQLPKLIKEVRELKKQLAQLQSSINE